MTVRILRGDCRDVLKSLPGQSVHCVVTSPPYWGLRDYGVAGQIGLEGSLGEYVDVMVSVFREVKRVLRDDGTLWLNLGDSYASSWACARRNIKGNGSPDPSTGRPDRLGNDLKEKDLCGIPWRVAFALQADGWYLRQDIIWSKPNPMPESVTDRCTKAHEYIFLLGKSGRYFYDAEAIKEPAEYGRRDTAGEWRGEAYVNQKGAQANSIGNGGRNSVTGRHPETGRNKRSVWEVATAPFSEAHFATFPPALIEPCILAGCPRDGTVLDPFGGAGTTGLVADRLQRNAILIELNPNYADMTERRLMDDAGMFAAIETIDNSSKADA
jgi:DNA modification methylase